jgi:hypothetical protein
MTSWTFLARTPSAMVFFSTNSLMVCVKVRAQLYSCQDVHLMVDGKYAGSWVVVRMTLPVGPYSDIVDLRGAYVLPSGHAK